MDASDQVRQLKELFESTEFQRFASELLPAANRIFGTSARNMDEFVDSLLDARVVQLKRLAELYETQMLACQNAKAFFAAAVMGAAMIEAVLLLLCILEEEQVKTSWAYKRRADTNCSFDQSIWRFGLDDLIWIAAERDWVPEDLISIEWRKALPEAWREMLADARPNSSKASREETATWVGHNTALTLMRLMNMMRNRVHPGRWLKERSRLEKSEAFDGWAQATMLAAGQIRDCLIVRMQLGLKKEIDKIMSQKLIAIAHGKA